MYHGENDMEFELSQEERIAAELEDEREQTLKIQLRQNERSRQRSLEPKAPPKKKKLKRELRREALTRLEEAARTQRDFDEVVAWWNKLDALNVGALQMNRKSGNEVRDAVMEFVGRYGLLDFLTALPTTPSFMDYEAVYLPKNHFIREESMTTQDYLTLFFPFEKLDIYEKGVASQWNLTGEREMMALALAMQDAPRAVAMSFQREYAERYNWLMRQFKDLAFSLP